MRQKRIDVPPHMYKICAGLVTETQLFANLESP